jgi:aspartate racemase
MGPEATADLFMKIIKATPAERDQDHLHVVIDSRPQVPDRTAALFEEGADPSPELARGVELLVNAGVDFIIIPCNTAHCFYSALEEASGRVPVLHMMGEVADYLANPPSPPESAGLLATTGTVRSRVYHEALEGAGISTIIPDEEGQRRVMRAIYDEKQGIKVGEYGHPRELLGREAERLASRGAEVIIAGCTEIPLALRQEDLDVPYIDATDVLARAAVNRALALREQ